MSTIPTPELTIENLASSQLGVNLLPHTDYSFSAKIKDSLHAFTKTSREYTQGIIGTLQAGLERGQKNTAVVASAGILAVGASFGVKQFAYPGSVSANTAAPVEAKHKRTNLKTQTILNKIHNALKSGDSTQNDNCKNPDGSLIPGVKCRHDRILPTSAHLEPSSGGFRTDCKNPYLSTFRYFEINTAGVGYHSCGPKVVWPRRAEKNEFKKSLDGVGSLIQKSAGSSIKQETVSIKGNRKRIVAKFVCLTEVSVPPLGIRQVSLSKKKANSGKNYSLATITEC